MKAFIPFLASWIIGVLAQDKEGPSFPTSVQLDVLFPRKGETHAPVYPFPFVFVIHNASTAWPYEFSLKWDVAPVDGIPGNAIDGWGYGTDTFLTGYDYRGLEPPPSTFLVINSTDSLVNATDGLYGLGFQFGFYQNCTGTEGPNGFDSDFFKPLSTNSVRFNISKENGAVPDIMGGGDGCAAPILGWTIKGESKYKLEEVKARPELIGQPCPIVEPMETLQECAFKATGQDAEDIKAQMIEVSGCPTNTAWPDAEGLVGPCPLSASSQNSPSMSSLYGVSILVLWWLQFRIK